MALKEVYSTLEASLLLGMAVKNLLQRAIREGWQSQPRKGRGGGHEWLLSSMPEETRIAIRAAEEQNALGRLCSGKRRSHVFFIRFDRHP